MTTSNKQVIILNGPAGCGKDELADYLVKAIAGSGIHPTSHKRFKTALYDLCKVLSGMGEDFIKIATDRNLKEMPHPDLNIGDYKFLTPRDFLITVSENVVKPSMGSDFFGEALVSSLEPGLNVVSDGGFLDELLPIISEVGAENVLILRIIRPNHDFAGDSRKYLSGCQLPSGVSIFPIINNGTLPEYLDKSTKVALNFLSKVVTGQVKKGSK